MAGIPVPNLSFAESRQQQTAYNQQGATINTGIAFAPLPPAPSGVSADSVLTISKNKSLIAAAIVAGLGLLMMIVSLFRGRK